MFALVIVAVTFLLFWGFHCIHPSHYSLFFLFGFDTSFSFCLQYVFGVRFDSCTCRAYLSTINHGVDQITPSDIDALILDIELNKMMACFWSFLYQAVQEWRGGKAHSLSDFEPYLAVARRARTDEV